MKTRFALVLWLLLTGSAAQAVRDSFDYPDGPTVPGWTQQRGLWAVRGGKLIPTTTVTWLYITRDGISARNSVIDATFTVIRPAVQFCGLTSRHPGGDVDANLLMAKAQSNGNVDENQQSGFERIFAYERPQALGTFYRDTVAAPPWPASVGGRLITLDGEVWFECDTNLDGTYDLVLPRRPVTAVLGAGLVGVSAYSSLAIARLAPQIDDFEYFDAVLVAPPGARARIGTAYAMRLHTPAPAVPWLGLLAFANTGIVLGDRRIPLALDDLLSATLGFLFTGVTDAGGAADFILPIPNNQAFVGLRLFASAVTIDVSKPFAVGHIANEQFLTLIR